MRIQGVHVFLVLQEISKGFLIPYQERSLNPSSTRKYEAKDEQETSLYKGARISHEGEVLEAHCRRLKEQRPSIHPSISIHPSPFHSFYVFIMFYLVMFS